jgi:ankyrin repeat protein
VKEEKLVFKRLKTKELFAFLVDRKGAGMTAKQICAVLFPDDMDDTKNAAYLRQLVMDLKNTLKSVGAENVLRQVGAKDVTEYMIERGVSLAIDSNGNSALGFALKNNLYIAAEYIIRSGKIDLNAPVDGEGRPPLSAALYYNQYDIADLLFDRGADVNKADKNGNTPIMYAVITAKKDRVKQFVDEGADVGAVNNQGKSVISFVMTLDISDAQKADMVKILDGRG